MPKNLEINDGFWLEHYLSHLPQKSIKLLSPMNNSQEILGIFEKRLGFSTKVHPLALVIFFLKDFYL